MSEYEEYVCRYYPDNWGEKTIALFGVPIVRCRDCIGLYETWDGWECERFSGEYHRAEPDGFCAWGERK